MAGDELTERDLRRAYRRVADPFGTPWRAGILVVALAGIALYAHHHLRGRLQVVILVLTPAATLLYAAVSFRVRRFASTGSPEAVRDRFAARARAVLKGALWNPFRTLVWGGLGCWAWAETLGWTAFPFDRDVFEALFVGLLGTLLGARALLEWLVEVPRLRRDLARMAGRTAPEAESPRVSGGTDPGSAGPAACAPGGTSGVSLGVPGRSPGGARHEVTDDPSSQG